MVPLRCGSRCRGPRRYALHSRYFLGATVDLEETYAWGWEELKRLSDDMAATADRILPGASRDEAVAAPRSRPGAPDRGPRGVPRLDAGPRRPDPRRARRRPLRHPRAGATHRVPAGPHERRRDLLHGPVGGLQPSRADVVVRAGRDRRLLAVARDHDGLPRGRAGPSPPGRPDRLPPRGAQPLAAADVLGQRPRRGLGALRRAADGRARLPRRPGRPARDARRAGASGRPG